MPFAPLLNGKRGLGHVAAPPLREGRGEALYLLPIAGEFPGTHRAEPEGVGARRYVPAPGEGRPVRRRLQGAEPANGGADPDRWGDQAVPVAGDPRISRRKTP